MSVDTILAGLDKVKRTGRDSYIACCPTPSHDDRSPSLSVRALDDGRVLVHCFGGCDVHEVLGALGLDISDLFPDRLDRGRHSMPRERRPFPAADVLRCVAFEALVVAAAAASVCSGNALREPDRARLITAAARLQAGAKLAGVAQ